MPRKTDTEKVLLRELAAYKTNLMENAASEFTHSFQQGALTQSLFSNIDFLQNFLQTKTEPYI